MFHHLLIITLSLAITQNVCARVFKIKEGNHSSSGIKGGPFLAKKMYFKAKFNDSSEYYLGNTNQYDTNKLYGFSDCYSAHHRNSARFGWVWNDRTMKVEIHAYSYSKNVRNITFISNVDLDKFYDFKIKVHKKSYEFILNDRSVHHPRNCRGKKAHGYKLYPYFGGNEPAPHDITVEIK